MKVIITRGGGSSFVLSKDNCFAINIGMNDDILKVFKWVNMNFRNLKK